MASKNEPDTAHQGFDSSKTGGSAVEKAQQHLGGDADAAANKSQDVRLDQGNAPFKQDNSGHALHTSAATHASTAPMHDEGFGGQVRENVFDGTSTV